MTTVYLIRHSKTLKVNNILNEESLQIQNEKLSLSLEGESIAKEKLNNNEFNDIDIVYSSNYVRAIQTAKYIEEKNNLIVNVINNLGERKFGINSWEKLPAEFESKQFLDENYKIGNGESQKEVRERMYLAITKILNENKDKRIAVVSHSTAITFLLRKWCEINTDYKMTFNNNNFFDGNWDYCETFKLEFENDILINIENIN